MDEPYSKEILSVLAFIRDHPACDPNKILTSLPLDTRLLMDALDELTQAKLVTRRPSRIVRRPFCPRKIPRSVTIEAPKYSMTYMYMLDGR